MRKRDGLTTSAESQAIDLAIEAGRQIVTQFTELGRNDRLQVIQGRTGRKHQIHGLTFNVGRSLESMWGVA